MEKLFSFDVTLNDLSSLASHPYEKTKAVMDILKVFWYEGQGGSDPDYLNRVRVGSVDVYLDDNQQLHLDFVTRFHLGNEPEWVEILRILKQPLPANLLLK